MVSELPPNCKVLSVTPSGKSLRVATVRILVQLEDGQTAEFFKKVSYGPFSAASNPL